MSSFEQQKQRIFVNFIKKKAGRGRGIALVLLLSGFSGSKSLYSSEPFSASYDEQLSSLIVGIESSFSDGRNGKVLSTGCIIKSDPNEGFYVLTVEHAVPDDGSTINVVIDLDSGNASSVERRQFAGTVILRHAKISSDMNRLLDDFERLYDRYFYPSEVKGHPKSDEFERTYLDLKKNLDGLRSSSSLEEVRKGYLDLSEITLKLFSYDKDLYHLSQLVGLNRLITSEEYFQRFDDANKRLAKRFNALVGETSVFTEIAVIKAETGQLGFENVKFAASKSASCQSLLMGCYYPQGRSELRNVVRDDEAGLLVEAEPGNSGSPVFCDGRLIGIVSTVNKVEEGKTSISYVSSESIYETLKGNQLDWLMTDLLEVGTSSDVESAPTYERTSEPSEATHVLLLREKPSNELFKPRDNRLYLRLAESTPKADEEGRIWLVSVDKKKSERSNGVTTRFNYEMKLGYGYENQEMHFVVKLVGTKNGEPYSNEESLPMRLGETQTYEVSPEIIDVTLKELGGSDI